MTQKKLALELKNKFDINYSIQGWNIYTKTENTPNINDVISFLEKFNIDNGLGYKRFAIKEDKKGRKSVF